MRSTVEDSGSPDVAHFYLQKKISILTLDSVQYNNRTAILYYDHHECILDAFRR